LLGLPGPLGAEADAGREALVSIDLRREASRMIQHGGVQMVSVTARRLSVQVLEPHGGMSVLWASTPTQVDHVWEWIHTATRRRAPKECRCKGYFEDTGFHLAACTANPRARA
jgi:hypothetical protein